MAKNNEIADQNVAGINVATAANLDTANTEPERADTWFLNISGEVEIFGAKLQGVIEKGESGIHVLVIPKDEEAQTVSLSKVAADLGRKFGCSINETALEDKIKAVGSFLKLNTNNIYIRQLYLYYDINTSTNDNTSTNEFAVSLELRGTTMKDTPELIAINRISFSIWNTKREKIIEKMQLITIDNYIKEITDK